MFLSILQRNIGNQLKGDIGWKWDNAALLTLKQLWVDRLSQQTITSSNST